MKATPAKRAHADQGVGDKPDRDEREHRRGDKALVERAHDRLLPAEPHEESTDDRRDDAGAADGERIGHHVEQHRRAGEEDRGQHHGRNDRHGIGLEQIGGHAGAIADVVADVVRDGGRIARIVFRNAGFDLADQIATDVGALGEDAAAETGKDRDQRGAEAERDDGVDDRAVIGRLVQRAGEKAEIERDAEQREAGDQHAGDGAGLEGKLQPAGQRLGRRLGDPHVGADRNVHPDEAGRSRQDGADRKADRHQPAEREADDHEDHDADDTDGGVLPLEIGLRALAHGLRNFLHLLAARIGAHHRLGRPDAICDREHPAADDQPQSRHGGHYPRF